MFKLMRFYSVASFIFIFATAALLTLFYRQVTIRCISQLAESNNLALANMALTSIRPELISYLSSRTRLDTSKASHDGFATGLTADISRLIQENSVERIKIYDQNGVTVLSTQAGQVGVNQSSSQGLKSALDGKLSNSMIYRDTFNRFEGRTKEDNLVQTYLPIRSSPNGPILGVFEMHSDMNHMVQKNNQLLVIFLIGVEFILALLYGVLIIVVRHAKNIIESQQKTIQERTATLESLYKCSLNSEEHKRQKIAINLHEGLAQTLSAIKVNVESNEQGQQAGDANIQPLESIVPVLQSAIQEVRSIATELRPSILDDLGLLPTVNWFCREFEQKYNGINIEQEVSLHETSIPVALKIIIYRIIESTFKNIAHYSSSAQIRLAMQRAGDKVHLKISHMPVKHSSVTDIAPSDSDTCPRFSDPHFRFAEIKERVSLSGGTFMATQEHAGWVTLRASWAC